MKNKLILVLMFMACCGALYSQDEHYIGVLLDDEAYEKIPQKATLLTRDYTILPRKHSLKQYCPMPSSQGNYGTCVGWASAYAARTITEAINNDWTDKAQINKEAFSPLFLYTLIKNPSDYNCQSGTNVNMAFYTMKQRGVAKRSSMNVKCANEISDVAYSNALNYKIDDYFTLFNYNCNNPQTKINATKKSISQNRPVVISMACYRSFSYAKMYWSGEADYYRGYHAMCVVGYDDDINGGSFLIMNSWGSTWGSGGFTWVKYSDYAQFVRYAIEMYVKKSIPLEQKKRYNLAGNMYLKLSTGEKMIPYLNNSTSIPYYKISGEYMSGTRYRVYISNNEPAYVYVIGSDLNNNVSKVFPPTNRISPALVYKSNNIAIPDEKWYIEMDNTVGKDYLCVLYSAVELPIDDIVAKIKGASGTFMDKLKYALGDRLVSASETSYGNGEIRFSAKSNATVVPLIAEVVHR